MKIIALVHLVSILEALIAVVIVLSTRYGKKEFWFAVAAIPALLLYLTMAVAVWYEYSRRWSIVLISMFIGTIYSVLPFICFNTPHTDSLLIMGIISIVLASMCTFVYAIRLLAKETGR
jgi:membrane-associated HD superfamily phosphohydrolase